MTASDGRAVGQLAATLGIGAAGGVLFHLIGFPAAPLTGSALAVSLAVLIGLPMSIPAWLRDMCFLTVGINIGSSVTPEVLQAAINWPVSFVVLSLTLIAGMLTSRALLQRLFGFDKATATLACTPGHLSYVMGLAVGARVDVVVVSLVQSTRVLFLTLFVPLAITLLFGETGVVFASSGTMSLLGGCLLYAAAFVIGRVFLWIRVPAAFLLAGMAVSGAGHLSEGVQGSLPHGVSAAALMIMGALIGTRFRGASLRVFRDSVLAGLGVTFVAMVFALLGAVVVIWWLGLPASLLVVAFAPGGVEAMAAIAVQAGLDPTFVAAHHVFRLILLTFLVPLLARSALETPPDS